MTMSLQLMATETPNPNGRKYKTNWILHQGAPSYFTQANEAVPLARVLLQSDHIVSVLFRFNEFTVERIPSSDWTQVDQDVDARLRAALLACAPLVESHDIRHFESDLENRVWSVLESDILPTIHRDGGDLRLLSIDEGVVKVSLSGACASCPASTLTLKGGVEHKLLDAFPTEIVRVEAI